MFFKCCRTNQQTSISAANLRFHLLIRCNGTRMCHCAVKRAFDIVAGVAGSSLSYMRVGGAQRGLAGTTGRWRARRAGCTTGCTPSSRSPVSWTGCCSAARRRRSPSPSQSRTVCGGHAEHCWVVSFGSVKQSKEPIFGRAGGRLKFFDQHESPRYQIFLAMQRVWLRAACDCGFCTGGGEGSTPPPLQEVGGLYPPPLQAEGSRNPLGPK